jgi:hypothetical protein
MPHDFQMEHERLPSTPMVGVPMKVKFFAFQLSHKGAGLFRGSRPRVENAAEIEAAMNEWLASRPGIRIAQVQQTASPGFGPVFLYLTVWYDEGAEPRAAPDRAG